MTEGEAGVGVRSYPSKAILTLRVHRIMDVDDQTDRSFSAIKIRFAGEKSDIFIISVHSIVGGYSLEPR